MEGGTEAALGKSILGYGPFETRGISVYQNHWIRGPRKNSKPQVKV